MTLTIEIDDQALLLLERIAGALESMTGTATQPQEAQAPKRPPGRPRKLKAPEAQVPEAQAPMTQVTIEQAPRTMLRAKQAAARLSIGLSTWKSWVAAGRVEPGKLVGAKMRVWDSLYIDQVMGQIQNGTFG